VTTIFIPAESTRRWAHPFRLWCFPQVVLLVYVSCVHSLLLRLTGLLTIARALDHEQKKQFQLSITASDHGHHPNIAWQVLEVNLEDVNDNPPHFQHSIYKANVSENSSPNRYVVTIHATDKDTGRETRAMYLLINQFVFIF
jgi:hypothetical protein